MTSNASTHMILVHQDDGTVYVVLEGFPGDGEQLVFERVDATFFVRTPAHEWVKEEAPASLWQAITDERCYCLCCTSDQVVHTQPVLTLLA